MLTKTRETYVPARSTPTLTQSGLLAVLLQRQRHKVIEMATRRAQRETSRSAFCGALNWLLARGREGLAGRPFRRGVGATLPRHP